MASKSLQILRSLILGNRPSSRLYGEPYVNFAENQFGVMNSSNQPQDLIGVPFFSAAATYAFGNVVNYQGRLYIAVGPVPAGAFNPSNWSVLTATLNYPTLPQGRLTLSSGFPVMNGSVAGATSTYYTPYTGCYFPIWNGASFQPSFLGTADLAQATSDATKSPAAVVANSNYDLFVWNDSGTYRCTRGPAWTNNTTRSAGTGLTRVQGIWVNTVAITNGPAAGYGVYVGSVHSNASSTFDWILGSTVAGGGMASLNVFNAYNRKIIGTVVRDSAANWFSTDYSWHMAHESATFRINFLKGLAEDSDEFINSTMVRGYAGSSAGIGLGLDWTSGSPDIGTMQQDASSILDTPAAVVYNYTGLLGFHYVQALEFYGPGGQNQSMFWGGAMSGFQCRLMM